MPTLRQQLRVRKSEQRCHPLHAGSQRARRRRATTHPRKTVENNPENNHISQNKKEACCARTCVPEDLRSETRKLYQLTFLGILCVTASQKTTQADVKCNPEARDGPGQHDAAAYFSLDRKSLVHRPVCFPLTTPKRIYVQQSPRPTLK